MLKPTPKNRASILDYNECARYIKYKLGYDIRDTLGVFRHRMGTNKLEYRDWWHFLIDHIEVHNPCEITIGSDLLEYGNKWQNEITQAFIDNFGDNVEYYVSW